MEYLDPAEYRWVELPTGEIIPVKRTTERICIPVPTPSGFGEVCYNVADLPDRTADHPLLKGS